MECAHLGSLGLWAKPYDLFEQCPCGGCIDRVNDTRAKLRDDRCNICGAKEDLVKTECCGITLCDTEYKSYQMGSYSREFCRRSHTRYTMCAFHKSARHEEDYGCVEDWRNCGECRTQINVLPGQRWCAQCIGDILSMLVHQAAVETRVACAMFVSLCSECPQDDT